MPDPSFGSATMRGHVDHRAHRSGRSEQLHAVSAAPLPRVAARRRPVVTVTQGGTLSGEHCRRHTDAALDAPRIVDVLGTRAPVPPPAVDRDGLRMDVVVLGARISYPLTLPPMRSMPARRARQACWENTALVPCL